MSWWRRKTSEAETLVRECEAFLAGNYLDRAEPTLDPPPPWAWLNLLAHGSCDELVDARRRLGAVDEADWWVRRWRGAQRYLAGEILDACHGDPGALRDLQRRILVPLELELTGSDRRVDPGALATIVVRALERDAMKSKRRHEAVAPPRPRASG